MALEIPNFFPQDIALSSSSVVNCSLCSTQKIHAADTAWAGASLSAAISLLFNLSDRLEGTALHIPLM